MNNPLDCSVIVLSFNTKDITDTCLSKLHQSVLSCQKRLKNKIEVIVIDNASSDGSLEMIKKKHPWVRLIASNTNTGFSGGNNLGMREGTKPFILLLNSDAYVEEDTLALSLEYFANHPGWDLLGCQLRFANGRLQPSAGYLPTPLNTVLWILGLALLPLIGRISSPIHPRDKGFFAQERQVEWVMGAFMMLKREVFNKTGGFDESIFMYGEEVEWCKRIKDAGFSIRYIPGIKITHLDKASSNFMMEKPLLNEIKGLVRYFHQHYAKEYFLVRVVMRAALILRIIAFTLLGKGQRRRAYWEALGVL